MIPCVDCREEIDFSEGEQKFFKQKGFTDPKRCPPCRKFRKAQKQQPDPVQAQDNE